MEIKTKAIAPVVAATLALVLAGQAFSAEPNKRRGQVYFKMVCTECHVQETDRTIPPNTRSMADWSAYMDADKHDDGGKSEPTVSYYTSAAYRESVKDSNKAARKFIKLPADQIYADVKAFMVAGARDSDTPASCD